MAKTADRIKSNILDENPIEIVPNDEMPPTKKLKQARLPFHPISPKAKMSKNVPSQASKKRKLTDPESPSAKTPKIVNKSMIDNRPKHTADKTTNKALLDKGVHDPANLDKSTKIPVGDNNDNEVSSSSEAENQPLFIAHRRRASETNLLERFVKKSSPEEISSTNDVIDLTDVAEDRTVVVSSTRETPTSADLMSLDKSVKIVKTEPLAKVIKLDNVIEIDDLKEDEDKNKLNKSSEIVTSEMVLNIDTTDVIDIRPLKELEEKSWLHKSEVTDGVHQHSKAVEDLKELKESSEIVVEDNLVTDTNIEKTVSVIIPAESQNGMSVSIPSLKNLAGPSTEDVTDQNNIAITAVVNTSAETDKTDHLSKTVDTSCSGVFTKPLPSITEDPKHVPSITEVTNPLPSVTTVVTTNTDSPKTDRKSCSEDATKQTLITEVADTAGAHIDQDKMAQLCASIKPCSVILEQVATNDFLISSVSDIKVVEKKQQCSPKTDCSDVTEKQIGVVEMIATNDVADNEAVGSDTGNNEVVACKTAHKDLDSSTKTEECISNSSSVQSASSDKTESDDVLLIKDDNEDDPSDTDCHSESLLDSSACASSKSDESFSETNLSTSTTSTDQNPRLVTSTPKNKPRSCKMSELKKQEREAARLEKLQQRETERLEKLKKKEAEKAQRQEEKIKKEKERLEKKAQLEQERLEKLQQKEDERKKRQELLDARLEEKKKKEEEKRLKDEERQKEEEEKMKKKQKVQQAFSSFFIKQKAIASKPKETISSLFMPFEVKTDMVLSPLQRRKIVDNDLAHLDEYLQSQNADKLYIDEIREEGYSPHSDSRTELLNQPGSVDMEIIEVASDVKKVTYPAKFLSFHTNYRPPYFGTWRKKSKVLTPRNPFKKDDEIFDYEVDSDDEWEEEEPGESLENSEGEEEKEGEEEEEEEEDGWMVPHGYLSEDEICEEDEEVTPEVLKARQMAKAEAWEAEMQRQCHPVLPLVVGCFWEGQSPADDKMQKLEAFKAVCWIAVPIPLVNDEVSVCKDSESGTPNRSGLKKPVPEEAMPYLIQLVHGNTIGIKKLVKEFRLFWKQKNNPKPIDNISDEMAMEVDVQESPNKTATFDESLTEDKINAEVDLNETQEADNVFAISKRQLEMKITAIATREKRQDRKICWFVHDSILEQYGCQGISLPNSWQYVSNVKKQLKTNDENSGRKTPKPGSENTPKMVGDENLESGQTPDKLVSKDQRSIMDFARKNTPIIFKEIEKPAPTPSVTADVLLTSVKAIHTDQRSIMNFTKKCTNDDKNAICITISDSPKKDCVTAPTVSPNPRPNTITGMLKPVTSHISSSKPAVSSSQVTHQVVDFVVKPVTSQRMLKPATSSIDLTAQPATSLAHTQVPDTTPKPFVPLVHALQKTQKVPDAPKPSVPLIQALQKIPKVPDAPKLSMPLVHVLQKAQIVPDAPKLSVPIEVFKPITIDNINVPAAQEDVESKSAMIDNAKEVKDCIVIE